ncbi:MAG: acetyl-CoA carboxylase carboxyltransferase subunit alpha [Acidobacteriota bacterium]
MTDEAQFEQPILELERRIEELSGFSASEENRREVERLSSRLEQMRREVFSRLTPWQKTLVARHPRRPYTLDYIQHLLEDFTELHGDRRYSDDPAVVAGFGFFHDIPVCVVGHQKGRDTREKLRRNFGMPRPEGYRKALRVMQLAERFGRPIFTLIDTPGAFPGIDAEERGQAEAIAVNIRDMAALRVPIITTVTGEGGSGGALALGVGDTINMLEFSIYSVISPEGCAAILWRDPSRNRDAARAMRITAPDIKELGIADEIISEVPGGAHTDPEGMAEILDEVLHRQLQELMRLSVEERLERRYQKYRHFGRFEELD